MNDTNSIRIGNRKAIKAPSPRSLSISNQGLAVQGVPSNILYAVITDCDPPAVKQALNGTRCVSSR